MRTKKIKMQMIKKIVGIQKRLVVEADKALHAEIDLRLKPIRKFLLENKEHIEEAVFADTASILTNIEDVLFVHLQIQWEQDGIDRLVEEQTRKDKQLARKAARRLGASYAEEDDDDDEEDEDEDYDDDDYNDDGYEDVYSASGRKVGKKMLRTKKPPTPRKKRLRPKQRP